jgi:D-glycero-D-manno-heptose 1,7-bisphosphate phosphatase
MIEMRNALFLDRDVLLNKFFLEKKLPISPPSFASVEILPGVKEAVEKIRRLNFVSLVVTNQPNVSRKKIERSEVLKINNYLQDKLKFDDIFICYHDDNDNCKCRKPKPGLLFEASSKWNINLKKSFMIGDRWKDIAAGKLAGCKTILVEYKHSEINRCKPDFIVGSLYNAVELIEKLSNEKN